MENKLDWYELYDYTLDDTDKHALYELFYKCITFYLAKGTYDVSEDKWGIGICNCCSNFLIKEFDCESSEMARIVGKQHIKEYLINLIEKL